MSLDVKKLENTTGGVKAAGKIVEAMREIKAENATDDAEASVKKSDISEPFLISQEEEARLVAALRDAALAEENLAVAQADEFWLLASLRARKGEVNRALALLTNYMNWRSSLKSEDLNPAKSEKMLAQLKRKMIFVAGNTDRDGRPVVSVRMRNQDPSSFAAIDTTRTISFVLEWTLRTYPKAQTHGIVLVNDLADIGFKNLDIRMPGVLQKAFAKTIPVRLASMNAINPPLFVRAIFVLFQNVMSQKLKARIRVFGKDDADKFGEMFEENQIMDYLGLGGSATWTDEQHEAWIQRLIEDCQTWAPATSYVKES